MYQKLGLGSAEASRRFVARGEVRTGFNSGGAEECLKDGVGRIGTCLEDEAERIEVGLEYGTGGAEVCLGEDAEGAARGILSTRSGDGFVS
jgi:hypothetical protein